MRRGVPRPGPPTYRSVMTHAPVAHELAQVNIARLKFPLDSPELKDFVDALDPVNAVADASDGFVWRLQSDDGNATDIAVFGNEWLIINMSVWRNTDTLTAFMYQGQHRELLPGAANGSSVSPRRWPPCGGFPPATARPSPRRRSGCCI